MAQPGKEGHERSVTTVTVFKLLPGAEKGDRDQTIAPQLLLPYHNTVNTAVF